MWWHKPWRLIRSLCLISWGTVAASSEENIAHVAFVFAGGVRSFIVPAIHESIRYNLINAFCPASNCVANVFVRFSIDDNTHEGVGFNAKGKKLGGNEEILVAAMKGLKRLQPGSAAGNLFYKVVNIGSEEEAEEMDLVTSQNFRQKIYRDLDPRRYSMYFNRAMAYKMMLEEEAREGKKHTWVVHARLDAGWGEAIRPFQVWSLAKVWAPDSWYADVPDTFLLLPRSKSDFFFDLDLQYNPMEIMCLGGPNFDPATTSAKALGALGYTPEQAQMAQAEVCMTKFSSKLYLLTFDKKANMTWTSAGASEVILKRKLAHYGMCYEKATIGYTSLFMFLARYPVDFVCFYLEPRNLIGWVRKSQHASDPIGAGCQLMRWGMTSLHNTLYGPNCNLETFSSKYPLTDQPMTTCLIDRGMTDWNFMPFRIRVRRKSNVCLTAVTRTAADARAETASNINPMAASPRRPSIALGVGDCIASVSTGALVHDYDQAQLFGLLPLSPLPQRIAYHRFDSGRRCLTVVGDNVNGPRHLEMQECHVLPDFPPQLFRVELVGDMLHLHNSTSWAAIPMEGDPDQLVPRLPSSSPAVIKWIGKGGMMCVTVKAGAVGGGDVSAGHEPRAGRKLLPPAGVGPFASLGPCFVEAEAAKRRRRYRPSQQTKAQGSRSLLRSAAVFVLERTRNLSPTT